MLTLISTRRGLVELHRTVPFFELLSPKLKDKPDRKVITKIGMLVAIQKNESFFKVEKSIRIKFKIVGTNF